MLRFGLSGRIPFWVWLIIIGTFCKVLFKAAPAKRCLLKIYADNGIAFSPHS